VAGETSTTQASGTQQTTQSSSGGGSQQTSSGNSGAQGGGSSQSTSQSTQQTTAARPDWLPEAHWDATGGKVKDTFGTHYNELVAFRAADESRRLTLPANPDAYKFELPAGFKPPEGMTFQLKADDPSAKAFAAWAHKAGLSQEQYSSALEVYAGLQIAQEQRTEQAKAAEVQKLGATGAQRKTAVDTWLNAMLGPELGAHMSKFTFTAQQVQGMEKLMQRFSSQGSGSFRGDGREPGGHGAVTAEQWEKMGPAERLDYARQHDQSKMEWRDPRAA
jgi:hypothetical protein